MRYYSFKQKERIVLPQAANDPAIIDILHNYTPGIEWDITFSEDDRHITVANPTPEEREGFEYVIAISEGGIYVEGDCYKDTARAFVSLMELIFCYGRRDYKAECAVIRDSAKTAFRAVHLCFFPEYSIKEMQKVIRVCGMAKYSHVVMEFWGSLKMDCMRELAWPEAHSKDEIRTLVKSANALGMEVIPFFQHLGHASLSRLGYSGKHVVLDQNPELDWLYYPKSRGWVWNFKLDEVKELLSNIRDELIELCGEGEYFHLGCDESGLQFDANELTDYLAEVAESLKARGRRAIIWGDMMLSRSFDSLGAYECNSSPEYARALLEKLDKSVIVADWQYNIRKDRPWKSSTLLKEKGFDVICSPWQTNQYNSEDAIFTANEGGHLGLMVTTWDKLFSEGGIYKTVFAGLCAWGDPAYKCWFGTIGERSYNMYRRVSPRDQVYDDCGWRKKQV